MREVDATLAPPHPLRKIREATLRGLAGIGALLLMGGQVLALTNIVLDAKASDPVALGWMQGTPPPPDKLLRFDDSSVWRFPQLRWTYSHWREIWPTVGVSRGTGAVSTLPKALRADLDSVSFTPIGATTPTTWGAAFDGNYTDGLVVLHKGRIVQERYAGALSETGDHIAFSVTKSFVGTLAAMLIDEGKLDRAARVDSYLPELAGSGFGDATVGQVMDMTTALKFSEEYGATGGDFLNFALATGTAPRRPEFRGPTSNLTYAATIPKDGEHGRAFVYRTPNTDVLGWLVSRIEGRRLNEVLSARIWSKLGAEGDAYLHVDPSGMPFAGGGLNTRLRDLARFGEMIRLNGRYNGQQIVPAKVIAGIRSGGDPAKFGGYPTLPGWSYHDQWWHSHNANGAFMARGIHGQAIYIDPKAEVVIARYASHPVAGNRAIDPLSIPAYAAIVAKLTGGH